MDSLNLTRLLHATIRHAGTNHALMHWAICGNRITLRVYSSRQYVRAHQLIAKAWTVGVAQEGR